jgi:hypothetical protein
LQALGEDVSGLSSAAVGGFSATQVDAMTPAQITALGVRVGDLSTASAELRLVIKPILTFAAEFNVFRSDVSISQSAPVIDSGVYSGHRSSQFPGTNYHTLNLKPGLTYTWTVPSFPTVFTPPSGLHQRAGHVCSI